MTGSAIHETEDHTARASEKVRSARCQRVLRRTARAAFGVARQERGQSQTAEAGPGAQEEFTARCGLSEVAQSRNRGKTHGVHQGGEVPGASASFDIKELRGVQQGMAEIDQGRCEGGVAWIRLASRGCQPRGLPWDRGHYCPRSPNWRSYQPGLTQQELLRRGDLLGIWLTAEGSQVGGADQLRGNVPMFRQKRAGQMAGLVQGELAIEHGQGLRRRDGNGANRTAVHAIGLIEGREKRIGEIALGQYVDRTSVAIAWLFVGIPSIFAFHDDGGQERAIAGSAHARVELPRYLKYGIADRLGLPPLDPGVPQEFIAGISREGLLDRGVTRGERGLPIGCRGHDQPVDRLEFPALPNQL